jgi:hypothetical protein
MVDDAVLEAERRYVRAAANAAATKAALEVYDKLDPDRAVGSFDPQRQSADNAEKSRIEARRHFESMKSMRDYAVKTFI